MKKGKNQRFTAYRPPSLTRWVGFSAPKTPQPQFSDLPKFLSLRQTAEILRVHPNTLRAWDTTGKLRAVRFGVRHDRRYQRDVVAALLETRSRLAPQRRFITRPHVLSRLAIGLGVVVILAMTSAFQPSRHALADGSDTTTTLIGPAACTGWANSNAATTIDVPSGANPNRFTDQNSARLSGQDIGVSSDAGTVTSSFDQHGPNLECSGFTLGADQTGSVKSVKLRISMTATGRTNSTELVRFLTSLDGETWTPLTSVPVLRGNTDYLAIDLPKVGDRELLGQLRVRIETDFEAGGSAVVRLDGLAATVTQTPSAASTPTTVDSSRTRELDRLTEFSQTAYAASDQPSILIPKEQTKRQFFFSKKTEVWKLQGAVLVDSSGRVRTIKYRTVDETKGDNVSSRLHLRMDQQHPGKYLLRVTMVSPAGSLVTIEEPFLWGVLAVNLRRADPVVGDRQEVSIGVLDDTGRTICNAAVKATITDPKGKKTVVQTTNDSIVANADCVDKGVTNEADYHFGLKLDQPGIYHLDIEAKTSVGRRTSQENFTVETGSAFSVERVDYPTRIYPVASYPVRIAVTPKADYLGLVTELVPADFQVADIFPSGSLRRSVDDASQQIIEWLVQWKAGQTHYLTYTFDAPDISPALFLTGPLTVGGSFIAAPDFKESRQWQIASDEVEKTARITKDAIAKDEYARPVQAVDLQDGDFTPQRDQLAVPTKPMFKDDEQAVVKVYKKGFELTADKKPKELNQDRPTKVSGVEILGPWKEAEPLGATVVTEDVARADQTVEVAHLVQNENFHPGVYTVRTTYSDGVKTSVEDTEFAWGVLVVNPEQSIYAPNDTATLDMAVLDKVGKTLCQADLALTITAPSGATATRSTGDGSIERNYDCDVHSVSDVPDYRTTYTPTEVGTYALALTSTMKEGQERTGSDQTYTVTDSFEVKDAVPFTISRAGSATRLYPVVDYTARVTVTANQDYTGTVSEFIPESFGVSVISDGGQRLAAVNGRTEIQWTVDWKAGDNHTFTYIYDPPNPSPRVYPLGPFTINAFSEARQWQLAADATRVWDGGKTGSGASLWSSAANWDLDTLPVADDTVVFDGSAGGTPNDASDWDNGTVANRLASLTVSSHTGAFTISRTAPSITTTYSDTSTGNAVFSGTSITVAGAYTMNTSGTLTPNTSTLILNGTAANINTSKTHYAITLGTGAVKTIITNSFSYSNLLTIGSTGTLNISSGLTLTSTATTGTPLTITGATLNGPGRITYRTSTAFPSDGTLGSTLIVRYDNVTNALTTTARLDYGYIEAYNSSASNRTMTLGAGRHWLAGDFTIMTAGTGQMLVNGAASNTELDVDGTLSCSTTSSGVRDLTTGSSALWTFGWGIDFTNCSTVTATAGNKITMTTNARQIIGNGKTLANLTISADTTILTSNLTVSNALTVDTGITLTITGVSLTLSGNSGTTLTLNGLIVGTGTLVYQNSATTVTTSGTLSSNFTFDMVNGNMTIPNRSFGGAVTGLNTTGLARQLIFGASVTPTFGSLDLTTTGTGTLLLDGATNNPTTVTVSGAVTTSAVNGAVTFSAGSGNWAVAGNFNLTNVTTFNHNSGTLTMTGSGTLTSNSKTLNNLTTSGGGTPILANATHTVAGNLNFGATGLTAGTSTVVMTGASKTIDGGGKTLNNLTISGTVALQNTDLTVGTTLTIDVSQSLTLNSGRTLTLSANTGTSLSLSGTLNGPGRLTYQNTATTFPTGGALGAVLILRFDTANGNMTIPARTDYGTIEVYKAVGVQKTVQLGTAGGQTITLSGNLDLQNAHATAALILDASVTDTINPTVNITGNVTNSDGTGAVTMSVGSGNWTVTGNFDLTNVDTFNHNLGTLTMNGGGTLTSNGLTLNNLTINSSSAVTLAAATHALAGNLILAGAGTPTVTGSTVNMTGSAKTIDGGGKTIAGLTITGNTTVQTNNLTVSGLLTIAASKTLTITTVTLTNSGTTNVAWGDGTSTIDGTGLLTFTSGTTGGPGTTGVLSVPVRFDATAASIPDAVFDGRTYGGAVTIYSNAAAGKSVSTVAAGTYVFSSTLTVTTAGAGATTLDMDTTDPTAFTVAGTLTIGATSIIEATSAGTFNINGSYANSGTFTHHSGTVTAAGTAQQGWSGTLSGATGMFNNLIVTNAFGDGVSTWSVTFAGPTQTAATFTAATASTKLRFNATSTYTFQNFTVNGLATGTRVVLASSTGASAWLLTVAGTASVDYADVNDSNNTGANICATHSISTNGGNTGWTITAGAACGSTISVTGRIYTNDGTTALDCTTPRTVGVRVMGGTASTVACTNTPANGTYTVTGVTIGSAADVVSIYLSGATEKANTVTLAADTTTTITADLYQDRLIVRHENAGPMTNSTTLGLGKWDKDNDATNFFYTSNTTTTTDLVLDAGKKLIVWTGKGYTPGGLVTTTAASTQANPDGDLTIQTGATLTMGANALSVGGDYTNSGTFAKSSTQTTSFTATGTGFTITPGTGNFENLTFNGSGGDWAPQAATTLDGTLTMTAGQLKGTQNVTVTKDAVGSAGTINLTGGLFKQRVAAAQNFGPTTASTAWTFYDLEFSNSHASTGYTVTTQSCATCGVVVTDVLTLGKTGDAAATTLNAGNKTWTLSGAVATPFDKLASPAATFTASTSTVAYTGIYGSGNVNVVTASYYGLTLNPASAETYVTSGNITTLDGGNITVDTNATFSSGNNINMDAANCSLTLNGIITGAGTLIYACTNNAFPTTGTLTIGTTRFRLYNGTVTAGARNGASPYGGNLDVQSNHTGVTRTLILGTGASQTIDVSGNFTVTSNNTGTIAVDGATNNPTINVTGGYSVSGAAGPIAVTSGSGTWTFGGSVNLTSTTYTATSGNTLAMNGASKTLTTNAQTLDNLTFAGSTGTTTLADAVSAAGNVVLNNTIAAGTLTMTGSKNLTGGAATLANLTVNGTNNTVTLIGSDLTVSTALAIGGDANVNTDVLSLSSGLTLSATGTTTITDASDTISGGGTLRFTDTSGGPSSTGTLSSLVRYDASTSSILNTTFDARTYGGAVELYANSGTAKSISAAAGGYIFSSTLTTTAGGVGVVTADLSAATGTTTVTGNLVIGATTSFTAPVTLSLGASFTNNGVFTDSGGTVTFNGTGAQILSGTMTGSSDFNNLTLANTSGANPAIDLQAAVDTAGTLAITTASEIVQFKASTTYAPTAINLNGQATGTRAVIQSSTPGTQFTFSAGAGSRTVANAAVKDSNACGSTGGSIDGSDGTNEDRGNNTCWNINTISMSISDVTVGFGTCAPGGARFATGTSGSGNDTTDAHTITLATSAHSGYALTVFGPTLTGTPGTITGLGGSAVASNPGTEQFGLRAIKNSGLGTITSPFDTSNWAYGATSSPQPVASYGSPASSTEIGLRYLCNVSATTEPGTYSTDLTYVLTGTF